MKYRVECWNDSVGMRCCLHRSIHTSTISSTYTTTTREDIVHCLVVTTLSLCVHCLYTAIFSLPFSVDRS